MRRVLGRFTDIPRIKGTFVVPSQIEMILRKFPALGRFQLIIDRPEIRDVLTLKVEYEGSLDIKNLTGILEKEMKETIRLKTNVDLVKRGTLPEGASLIHDLRKA